MDPDIVRRNRRYLNSLREWIAPEDCRASRAGRAMVRDDLGRRERGPLTRAFRDSAAVRCRRYRLAPRSAFRLELNGWLGQHERRAVGVVSGVGLGLFARA